ncbi:hypothetical protein Bca4012_083060 [Brassica carinata]
MTFTSLNIKSFIPGSNSAVAAAEKELSESVRRCGGKREGQLRKEREIKDVERALNVVEEMERADEQIVNEMEVTRRNWEPAWQVMTVVGMLRDSRALTCCGLWF